MLRALPPAMLLELIVPPLSVLVLDRTGRREERPTTEDDPE